MQKLAETFETRLLRVRLMFKLLFAGLTSINCFLKLALCNVVKAHANKIVWCESGHPVSFLNEFKAKFKMKTSLLLIRFDFN
jgi:hypothetical protein